MVNNERTGCAAMIRAHVAEHPNCTGPEIAAAIGQTNACVSRNLFRMAAWGMLVVTKDGFKNRYTLGREPQKTYSANSASSRKRDRAEYYRARRKHAREAWQAERAAREAPQLTPAPVRCESVDAFIAHGGRVERLPSSWENPNHRAFGNTLHNEVTKRFHFTFGSAYLEDR